MLSIQDGLLILASFLVFMVFVTYWQSKKITNDKDSFLVANREIGWLKGAFSIAASWIWAPALFISSQKAFQQGIPGIFWFTVPNILTLIVFGFLAVRIRRLLPHGYTLPEYISIRYDTKTHIVYIFMFLALQVCSVAVQLLAGAAVIHSLTNIPIKYATLSIAFIFLSYSLISGLRASVVTDFFQMLLILFTCFVVVPLVLFSADGWTMLKSGLGGVSGNYFNLFNRNVAVNFGIIVTIGLLAGPIGDQMHWQRALALNRKVLKRAYIASGFVFGLVPVLLSALGFVAAGMVKNGLLTVSDPQLCGVLAVNNLLPQFLVILFVFMLLSGLASTGDSALCASSSLVAIDIYKRYFNKEAKSKQIVSVSRATMVVVTLLAVFIALIPNMKILYLFLFYGTLRACDMVPTILSLYVKKLSKSCMFWGVVVAAIFGLPVFVYGYLVKVNIIKVAASVGVVLVSFVLPLIISFFSKHKVDFQGNSIE